MLDLKIREGSGGRKSLDDVMRGLYRKYYLEKKRGFTDAEFRQECESAAGGELSEVFDYAATTREVNYAKYFALAGLKLDSTIADAPGAPGAYLGVDTQTEELPPNLMPAGDGRGGRGRGGAPATRLVVTDVAPGSPAETAGLRRGHVIVQADRAAATAVVLSEALRARKSGDRIHLRISSGDIEEDIEITLAGNFARTYKLDPMEQATPAQSAISSNWLRVSQ